MKDKTIYFDFDGTLVDVSKRFYCVYNNICKSLGVEIIEPHSHWQARQQKKSTREILEMSKATHVYQDFIAQRTDLIEAKNYLKLDSLRDSANHILDALNKGSELRLVSLRNKPDNLLWQLENLGLSKYFTSVDTASAFGSYEDKMKIISKYHPKKRFDFIIGDTESDILAGKELGLITIGILGGMRTDDKLMKLEPDYLISELSELKKIIK